MFFRYIKNYKQSYNKKIMKIKDLFERVINILNDNFYSIITKIDNIFVSAKELKTSIDKIKNDVYNVIFVYH